LWTGCRGVSSADGTCLAHLLASLGEDDLRVAVKRLALDKELDARGVEFSGGFLGRFLNALFSPDEERHLTEADFRGATFIDDATFDSTRFGVVRFDQATFTGDASFHQATFTDDARFNGATFTGNARFDSANFRGDARFEGANFSGDASFAAATFAAEARFGATFTDDTRFDRATFAGNARFDRNLRGERPVRPRQLQG
jgi:uncharacterized protein YjbI with pentapeptide repeats